MKRLPQSRLNELVLEITNDCPLQCLHCSSMSPSNHEMLKGTIYKILSDALDNGVKNFVFSGGEPTLHPYLPHALKYTSENMLGVENKIYTCGVRDENKPLHQKTIGYLAKQRENTVVFSLHGREATHDLITATRGSYQAVMKSISEAVRNKIDCELNFVPTNLNWRELQYIAGYAYKMNISQINILRFVPQGRGLENRLQLQMKEEDEIKLLQLIKDINNTKSVIISEQKQEFTRQKPRKSRKQKLPKLPKLQPKPEIKLEPKPEIELKPEPKIESEPKIEPEIEIQKPIIIRTGTPYREISPEINNRCNAGVGKLVIQADGNIIPCEGFKDTRKRNWLLSIMNMNLMQALNAPQIKKFREEVDSDNGKCPVHKKED